MEYRIGIDLGGTAIKMGVVDENYNVLFKRSLPTAESFERAAGDMADCAERLAGEAGLELRRFRCAGMGVTGGINKQGLLIYSGNTTWADVSLKREMEKHFPIPVYIGNDADCALIGESLAGAAKGYKNIVMLTLGTGVGGGIIIDGRLYSGDEYMSTEPGHFPLFHDGLSCGCGSRGCLETYASASALVRQAEEAMTEHPESSLCGAERACGGLDGRIIFECARQGDETALAVIDRYEEYLAHGIGGLISILRPDIFIIGGGISAQGDYLLNPVREKVRKYTFRGNAAPVPPIACATRGNSAGTIGAAFLDKMGG